MLYLCPACQHEQSNPEQLPLCPQCGHEWASVDPAGKTGTVAQPGPPTTSVMALNSLERTFDNLSSRVHSSELPSPFEKLDFSGLMQLSGDPLNVAPTPGGLSSATPGELVDSSAILSVPSTAPFAVSVNKVPQDSLVSRVCLEIRLSSFTANALVGHLWLTDTLSLSGAPVSFTVPSRRFGTPVPGGEVTIHPVLNVDSAFSGHIAIRVQPTDSGDAFWQGDLILNRQHNGQIQIDIDKSIRSETHLGGIDNGVVNIYANQFIGSNWQEVQLRRRGPKDLADPTDVKKPYFSAKERPLRIREGHSEIPAVETARLTLSHSAAGNRECYVQLFSGTCLHLGRARTWDSGSKSHREFAPNDIVLRTHREDESDDYISRYHGRIEFTSSGVVYRNLSSGGTLVGQRKLSQKDDFLPLSDDTLIRPGHAMAVNKDQSFGLRARRTVCYMSAESYNLLAEEAHLDGRMSSDVRNDNVMLTRTDRLQEFEKYVFFQQAVRVGAHPTCGWQISANSVQPVHATILWFDGSFWIEPYAINRSIRVNGTPVVVNRVRRLLPNFELEIGELKFLVLPEWKQHIINCGCCGGHGYEEGCRCTACTADWKKRYSPQAAP